MKNVQRSLTASVLAGIAILALSCGGGSGAPNPPGGNNGPAPGTADIEGRLLEGAGGRVASTVGDGLTGIPVSLINSITGALQGSTASGAGGNFEFKAIPSGGSYLVKVEFTSNQDLNNDGLNDRVELYFPLNLADQSITELVQTLGLPNSNSIDVRTQISDDRGRTEDSRREHHFLTGSTSVDSNSDGSFERSFDDSDCDGLPDASFSGGSMDDSTGIHELEVKGAIEELSATSITVSGTAFMLTATTTWRIGDDRNASPSEFAVGDFVEVEGFANGSGGWIAFKVKTEDDIPGSDDPSTPGDELELRGVIEALGAGSITVGGTEFVITETTTWRIGEDRNADPSQFAVGMFVEITGDAAGGGWNARKVKIEDDGVTSGGGGDDDGTGDQGGDNDDGAGDDNGGDDSGDDSNDDSGGDDSGDDDGTDDQGGDNDDDDSTDDNGGDDEGDDSGADGGGDDGTPDQGSGDD